MTAFFKDLTKHIAYATGSIIFLITYWAKIEAFLIDHHFISIIDEGIIINPLVEIKWILLILTVLSFTGYIFFSYRSFRYRERIDLTLLLGGAFAISSMLYMLAKEPATWLAIAFVLLIIYSITWVMIKYLFSYIKTEVSAN